MRIWLRAIGRTLLGLLVTLAVGIAVAACSLVLLAAALWALFAFGEPVAVAMLAASAALLLVAFCYEVACEKRDIEIEDAERRFIGELGDAIHDAAYGIDESVYGEIGEE